MKEDRLHKARLVIATRNPHKLQEIKAILGDLPLKLFSLIDFPEIGEIEENGSTFEENALTKARTVFRATGLWTLADDSGLEVDVLGGAPGIFSARFAGKERDYDANNRKLLQFLEGEPLEKRGAQFRCVVAIVGPGFEKTVEGVVRGRIIDSLRGKGGFGYDPLFIPEGYQQTFAEMEPALKNRISHRAAAFKKAAEILSNLFLNTETLHKPSKKKE